MGYLLFWMVLTREAGLSIVAGVAAIGAVAIAGLKGVAVGVAGLVALAGFGSSIGAVVVVLAASTLADSILEIDFRM